MMRILSMAAMAALLAASPAAAQPAAPRVVESFPDLADLTFGAPVVLQATISRTDRVRAKDAPGLAAGQVRLLVDADVRTVLVSPGATPARIRYLLDTPADARGRPPKLKGASVLLFLSAVPGRDGQYRLSTADGQVAWTPAADAAVRRALTDARNPELRALSITGVSGAFHVPGSIPGEAESQFFLSTASGRPVSIVVLSRPGMAKSFSVALGDVVDDAATSVPRDTLLWYRLACALPATLPAAAVERLGEAERAAAAGDYAFVMSALGRCERTLG